MLAIIAAYAKNRVIGYEGEIPWDIPDDRARFREITMGHTVIMGRKTYESISHPLEGRTNIVISTTRRYDGDGCHTVTSLKEALDIAGYADGTGGRPDFYTAHESEDDIYIIGGQRLYEQTIDIADYMYLTEVDIKCEGDAYFPEFDTDKWIIESDISKSDGDLAYRFITYRKK